MIAVDSNVLVYAHRLESPWHERAFACMKELAEGPAAWAIPWPCIHEFLAIVTHPRIYAPPTPLATAIAEVNAWLESPRVSVIAETEGSWDVLRALLEGGRPTGGKIHDAKIFAICLHHGVQELWSSDRDFSRFSGLMVRNPLVPSSP